MIDIEFKDRIVEFPHRYAVTDNSDGTETLTPFPGEVTEEGTPVNAANLNKLKDGIFQAAPISAVMHFARQTPPDGWLECGGQAVSRTTYADLYAVIGTTFGNGNGSTTFNLPDLRGEFIRGWDNGRGVDTGRAFGTPQEGTKLSYYSEGDRLQSVTYKSNGELLDEPAGGTGKHYASGGGTGQMFTIRPQNIALLACIKY